MKPYTVKIIAYAPYPIEEKRQVMASNFRAGMGKALNEFWDDQGKDKRLLKRRKKIKNINLSIQKC